MHADTVRKDPDTVSCAVMYVHTTPEASRAIIALAELCGFEGPYRRKTDTAVTVFHNPLNTGIGYTVDFDMADATYAVMAACVLGMRVLTHERGITATLGMTSGVTALYDVTEPIRAPAVYCRAVRLCAEAFLNETQGVPFPGKTENFEYDEKGTRRRRGRKQC